MAPAPRAAIARPKRSGRRSAGRRGVFVEEVTFSSERKWSAAAFDDEALRGVYVLGAPEMLQPHLARRMRRATEQARLTNGRRRGCACLLFAYRPEIAPLHDAQGEPQLPPDLIPLGLLSFSDELRPEAQATLEGFAEAGIRLKIISGDNPQTVAALARQAGFARDIAGRLRA